ncbi:MAG: hypothetical protein L0216_21045 [Planctomycetales bacterium]|nr:hypothetical protein [Planctomycetales bacterium]
MRPLLLATAGLALTLGACRTSVGGFVRHDPRWASARESLGRVALIPPWMHWDILDGEGKALEVGQVVADALRGLPNASVIDPAPLLAQFAPKRPNAPIGDHELVSAARTLGLDTVCVMSVISYGGAFTLYVGVTLPPIGWAAETSVEFTLRVIEVRTGDLLVWAVMRRYEWRPLAFRARSLLPEDLAKELGHALAVPSDPKE